MENIQKFIEPFKGVNLLGVNLMHCDFDVITPAVKVLKKAWNGVVGVYPQHGYWVYPDWISTEVDYEKAKVQVDEWKSLGVDLFGGCCGTKPELISFLKRELDI